MREQDARAANRAMDRSVEDMYLNQLFTQAGQYARDIKQTQADEDYRNAYLDILSEEKEQGVGGGENYGNTTSGYEGGSAEDYSADLSPEGFQTGLFAPWSQSRFGMENNAGYGRNRGVLDPRFRGLRLSRQGIGRQNF